jgi:short-subunit dehydrogenase
VRRCDQVVLVTGAAGGIGRALCLNLGRHGARLALVDKDAAALQQLQEALQRDDIRCASANADVASRDQVRAAIQSLERELGAADILITAAGICGVSVVEDLRVPQLEEMLKVNFLGMVFAIDAVLPGMISRRQGHIVGISSLAAVCPLPFESAYCASKSAVATYLHTLRAPLRRRGIGLTVVYPGFVRTPLLDGVVAETATSLPPGTIGADEAAEKICAAIRRRARVACFPWHTHWLARCASLLPPAMQDWVMTRIAASLGLPL